jgi:hypothetical protein
MQLRPIRAIMPGSEEVVMIVATFFILIAVTSLYRVVEFAVARKAYAKPCGNCPYWSACLSRRVCRVEPSKDPELCILRWS